MEQKLLMKERHEETHNTYELHYEPVQTEGQCILKSVTPIIFNNVRYYLFCVLSLFLLGMPIVFVYWYPKFKLLLYYSECRLEDCTHFAVVNYDDQLTIVQKRDQPVQKEQSTGLLNEKTLQANINRTYFVNRYMKYCLIFKSGRPIVRADIYDYDTAIKQILEQNYIGEKEIRGREQPLVTELRRRFGPGCMIIDKPGLGVLFFRQIVQPLYFFIIATLIIWTYEGYYFYCGIIFITTAIGVIVNLYQTQTLNEKIYNMAYYEVDLHVLRGYNVVKISQKDVIPSDIVFLKDPIKIPFDAVVLEGSALLNESALTGESVPVVRKSQQLQYLLKLSNSPSSFKIPLRNNLICQGTTLIQVDNKKRMQIFEKYRQTYGIPVYVIRTNFVTLKGQLIRIISFPIEKTNIFQKQSSKFLIFLFILAVLSYSLLVSRLLGLVQTKDIIIKFLDLITITVPPGLPVSMTFGIIHAIQKLKKKDIYCVSPNKVIMGGLVDFICFDKTGTLTEDYMDFKCLVPCYNGIFQAAIQNPATLPSTAQKLSLSKIMSSNPPGMDHILTNMATNHTIVQIAATKQNVGDPMQIKLFEFGQYRFNDNIGNDIKSGGKGFLQEGELLVFGFESQRGHYGVVTRRMDFDSELLRMSVITKSSARDAVGDYVLYTKGSPEVILKIMKKQSLPHDYEQTLKKYASSGFRVLAIGHKRLQKSQILLQRTEIQNNLQFDGFQIFENRLKPQSRGAIHELKHAKIPCVMITGDNALTGCNMSYKCGIADHKKKMFIFNYKEQQQKVDCEEFKLFLQRDQIDAIQKADKEVYSDDDQSENQKQNQQVEMRAIETANSEKNKMKIGQDQSASNRGTAHGVNPTLVHSTIGRILDKISLGGIQICLTGSTYSLLFSNISLSEMDQGRKLILKSTKVYARAKPNDKARIIMSYQQGLGKVVSMCGDGANDCGALKQSDAGLSLSQTQASISAPFTSKVTNVGSMVELIKQCRAGLVTNFALFDIMALYSLIQYTSAVICQYYFSYPSDFSFLYWDVFGNFLFFLVFGYTGTADHLSQHKPSRSLFTLTNLSQVAIMYVTQLFGQVLMVYSLANFFADETSYWQKGGAENNLQAYKDNDNSYNLGTPQTSIIFVFSNFMYIFSFISFSISKPWRKQFWTNIPFMAIFVFVLTYSILLVVVPGSRLSLFMIQGLTHPMVNLYVLLVALIIGMFMYINQKCILEPIAAKLKKKFPNQLWI